MKVYKSDWVVVIGAALVLFGGKLKDGIDLDGTSTIPAPSAELQTIVKPIAALVVGENATADREEITAYRLALADFHNRDKAAKITTTNKLQEFNRTALRSFWLKTDMEGRYPTMWDAVDKALGEYLGIANADGTYKAAEFTAAMSAKTAEFYQALAWAFQQET